MAEQGSGAADAENQNKSGGNAYRVSVSIQFKEIGPCITRD